MALLLASYSLWVLGPFAVRINMEYVSNHSVLSSVDVKNAWSFTASSSVYLHGVVRHKDSKYNLYLLLSLHFKINFFNLN
jgi:hypothetical protein